MPQVVDDVPCDQDHHHYETEDYQQLGRILADAQGGGHHVGCASVKEQVGESSRYGHLEGVTPGDNRPRTGLDGPAGGRGRR